MRKYIYLLLCVIAFVNVSCGDDELNSKELLVFARSQGATSFEFTVTPSGKGASGVDLKLPLSLTREATVDVQVGMKADELLVDAYNEKHGTFFKVLPVSSVTISRPTVTIAAGNLESKDSVYVSISPEGLKAGKYLLPLTIGEVESPDKGIRGSETASTLYYKVEVFVKYLTENLSPVIGPSVETINWGVSATQESDKAINLIDGNRTSNWRGAKEVVNHIEIDMKEVHALKGINFYYEASNRSYCPQKIQVFVSEDGAQWVYMGTAGSYVCTGYSNIKQTFGINFQEAMSLRYFRLIPTTSNSRYYAPQINEIEAVK